MSTIHKSIIDSTTAKQATTILSSFLGESTIQSTIPPEEVQHTDDIGECSPFNDLVKQITGENTTALAHILPFESYNKFDTSRLDHTFRITTIHKDVSAVTPEIKKYNTFYTLTQYIDNEHSLISNASSASGIANPGNLLPSQLFKYLGDQLTEATNELRRENIPHVDQVRNHIRTFKNIRDKAISLEKNKQLVITGERMIFPLEQDRNKGVFPGSTGYAAQRGSRKHAGVDLIVNNTGGFTSDTKVLAAADGTVIYTTAHENMLPPTIQWSGSWDNKTYLMEGNRPVPPDRGAGNYIVIFHPHLDLKTYYYHLGKIHVTKNQTVRAGDMIGIAGSTGFSQGVHLHFEVRKRPFKAHFNSTVDPLSLIGRTHATGFQLTGNTASAKRLLSEYRSTLQAMISGIEMLHHNIMTHITSALYTTYVNDISGKAEEISINWQPGTTVSIPLEGENAPICQSLGGRLVQVTLKLKEQHPVDIARIALLFKVTNNNETIAGMLTLARSAFNAGISLRHEYVQRWYRAEQVRNFIDGMSNNPAKINLDEPVLIENELLNGLGLNTFQPVSLEVQTVSQAKEAYEILLTFNYLNVSNRNTESLKKSRYGSHVPLLPITTRVWQNTGDHGELGLDSHYKLYGILTKVAIKDAITELLPIYCMHKIYKSFTALNKLAREQNTNSAKIDITDSNVFLATLVPPNMHKHFMDTLSTNRSTGVSMGHIVGKMSTATSGITSWITGGILNNQLIRMAQGKKMGKWGLIISSVALIANTTLRCIYGSAGIPENDPSSKTLYINIPSIMPVMIWSFLTDFIEHLSQGKENDFILDCAKSVLSLLNDSKQVNERDRTLRFCKDVEIQNGMGVQSHVVRELHISMILSGSHTHEQFKGAWFSEDIHTGIGKLSKMTKESKNIRESLLKKIQDKNIPDRERTGYVTAYAALEVNWLTIDTIITAASVIDPLSTGDKNGRISTFFNTASLLYRSESARKHAIEVLTAVCTNSMMDSIANGLLNAEGKSAQYGHTGSFSYNTQLATDNLDDTTIRQLVMEAVHTDVKESIVQARSIIRNKNISPQTLSGYFADGTFGGNAKLRKGYCNILLLVVTYMYKAATGTDNTQPETLPSHGKYPRDYTIGSILEILDRGRWAIIGEEISKTFMHLGYVLLDLLPSLVTALIAAFVTGGLYILVRVIQGLLLVFESWGLITSLFSDTVMMVLGHGSLFALSQWCTGRISESMDRSQLVECCYITQIWMPSALEFDSDAHDTSGSSYMDFPIILTNNSPLPPDFYIHKCAMTKNAYERMKSFMNEVNALIQERYGDLTGTDITNLRKQLTTDLNHARNNSIAELESLLTRALLQNKPTEVQLIPHYMIDLGKCGDWINLVFYGDNTSAQSHGGIVATEYTIHKSTITPLRSMLSITFTTDSVRVSIGSDFSIIAGKDSAKQAFQNRGTCITRIVEAANASDNKIRLNIRSFLQSAIPAIMDFIEANRALSGEFVYGLKHMPGTLGNLLLLKSIVGSSMRAIGKPGRALFSSQINKIGKNSLRRAAVLQTQYMFPTIKLYFIEEDDENFYLFDDLYSYASIISVSVTMDKDSPLHVAEIRITNLFGRLNNVMSDSKNKELHFLKGPDENAPLNAIMLRPGCKIKIQIGNSPLLSEEDTVFTGRISSLNFGPLTTIEASSHGDMLLDDLSRDTVKVYGAEGAATGTLLGRVVSGTVRDAIRNGMEDYLTPVTKIKHVIGYVLNDVVQASERLTDFSIRPPVEVQDPELYPSSTKLMDTIKKHFFKSTASEFASLVGGARINIHTNQQLFENIHIRNDLVETSWLGMGTLITEGFWISRNENAWDIMQELNLLLPNHIVTVRPYDTRSTLVWNDQEGYYRFRRTVDTDNIMIHGAASKILPILRDPQFKLIQFLLLIKEGFNNSNHRKKSGALALLAHLAYVSQRIYGSFMQDAPNDYRVPIMDNQLVTYDNETGTTEEVIQKALRWIPLELINNSSAVNTALINIYENIADENDKEQFSKNGISSLQLKELSPWKVYYSMPYYPPGIRYSNRTTASIYLLSLNFAAENIAHFMSDMVMSQSRSYRHVSDFHIKMSGRDIVKNDIRLNEPYNTVKLLFPKRETDDPEDLAKTAILGSDDATANEIMVPLHYKLKPWSQKVYQTYFKNANAFRTARTQAISTASSSILTNLMAQTYGGTITILGDSRIREGDRIFLWDENKDMYGVIKVKSHTLIIDPEQGCLSIIEPEMITRNDGKFKANWFDSIVSTTDLILDTLIVGAIAVGAFIGLRKIRRSMLMRAKAGVLSMNLLTRYTRGITKSLTNLRQNIPGLRLFTQNTFSWFNGLDNGKYAKNIARAYATLTSTMANIFTDRGFLTTTISGIRKAATTLQGSSSASRSISRIGTYLNKRITDRRYFSILNTAYENTMKQLATARHIGPGKGKFDFTTKYMDEVSHHIAEILSKDTGFAVSQNELSIITKNIRESIAPALQQRLAHANLNPFKLDGTKGLNTRISEMLQDIHKSREHVIKHVHGLTPDKFPATISNWFRSQTGSSGTLRNHMITSVNGIMDNYRDECMLRSLSVWRWIKNNSRVLIHGGIALATVSEMYALGKRFGELALLTRYTSDTITLAPLLFRGEPFISGLEGVTKKDGEDVGFLDIMKSRFESAFTGAIHNMTDPWQNALFELTREMYKVSEARKR